MRLNGYADAVMAVVPPQEVTYAMVEAARDTYDEAATEGGGDEDDYWAAALSAALKRQGQQ